MVAAAAEVAAAGLLAAEVAVAAEVARVARDARVARVAQVALVAWTLGERAASADAKAHGKRRCEGRRITSGFSPIRWGNRPAYSNSRCTKPVCLSLTVIVA